MIVFISNFLNHHQLPLSTELYKLTDGDYRFIEMSEMPDSFKKNGFAIYDGLPWLIRYNDASTEHEIVEDLIVNADTVILAANAYSSIIKRRLGLNRLTFEIGERWLKRGWINIFSPSLIKSQLLYHLWFYKRPLYRLNCSAYAANDLHLLRSFGSRMFKWGYFTAVGHDFDKRSCISAKVKILFVARFLDLKHPELPVMMAKRLKDKGINFELNMYGSGPELGHIGSLICRFDLTDCVRLCGTLPNEKMLEKMREHDIFVFTSDRHEGWGAVINEAMSSKCAVVASDAVGSSPYLIEHGVNGFMFKDQSVDDLTSKVEMLIKDPDKCREMGENAYKTLKNIWSPENAAKNLLLLIDSLKKGKDCEIVAGPCSPAEVISPS